MLWRQLCCLEGGKVWENFGKFRWGLMFAGDMETAREVGGVPSTVLIPMPFVWPYGGRSVFLCGSFTRWDSNFRPQFSNFFLFLSYLFNIKKRFVCSWRWSKLVQMTPVEGCPTVFQAIYGLTPGYHQVSWWYGSHGKIGFFFLFFFHPFSLYVMARSSETFVFVSFRCQITF